MGKDTKARTQNNNNNKSGSLNVGFLHPDLGIGGAERLIVDAALGLKSKGHNVCIYTSHHDDDHCFEETKDGTLRVEVNGDFLPRHLFHRFHVVFSILRSIWTAIMMVFKESLDVIIVDQISATIPLLKILTLGRTKIVFYCHFPDKLLTQRNSVLKKLYRLPIDWIEGFTTSLADVIVVNSKFTRSVFKEAFPNIKKTPSVLYPSLNFEKYDAPVRNITEKELGVPNGSIILLSINRFERKKNINLAIESFHRVVSSVNASISKRLHLVIAGGYDHIVRENVEHLLELQNRANELGMGRGKVIDGRSGKEIKDLSSNDGRVTFILSFTEEQRAVLLQKCCCMLYTPSNEHFGIGPLEAMYASRPVIAVNCGGPLETVLDGKTGFLRESDPESWAEALKELVTDEERVKKMGKEGRLWVSKNFSLEAFANSLNDIVINWSEKEQDSDDDDDNNKSKGSSSVSVKKGRSNNNNNNNKKKKDL